jgi:hypothetical protein
MKYVAFRDRRAPRDLFDLAHLTMGGAFNEVAESLIEGLSGARPMPAELQRIPVYTEATWDDQLAHQTMALMPAADALRLVRDAAEQLHSGQL